MRKWLAAVLITFCLGAGYLLAPLWVAMDIRRAVLEGDRTTLEARVDWPAVRASLKDSLGKLERERLEGVAAATPRPGLWQRIKAAAAPSRFVDQLIERYVTPEGVATLSARRSTLNSLVGRNGRESDEAFELPEHARPLATRAQQFWSRLKRVEFKSITTIAIEVADRRVPERSYLGTLTFAAGRWKVDGVYVRGVGF